MHPPLLCNLNYLIETNFGHNPDASFIRIIAFECNLGVLQEFNRLQIRILDGRHIYILISFELEEVIRVTILFGSHNLSYLTRYGFCFVRFFAFLNNLIQARIKLSTLVLCDSLHNCASFYNFGVVLHIANSIALNETCIVFHRHEVRKLTVYADDSRKACRITKILQQTFSCALSRSFFRTCCRIELCFSSPCIHQYEAEIGFCVVRRRNACIRIDLTIFANQPVVTFKRRVFVLVLPTLVIITCFVHIGFAKMGIPETTLVLVMHTNKVEKVVNTMNMINPRRNIALAILLAFTSYSICNHYRLFHFSAEEPNRMSSNGCNPIRNSFVINLKE